MKLHLVPVPVRSYYFSTIIGLELILLKQKLYNKINVLSCKSINCDPTSLFSDSQTLSILFITKPWHLNIKLY